MVDVTIIGDGEESVDLLLTYSYLIAATNPNLSAKDHGNVLNELKLFSTDDFDGLDEHYTKGKGRYRISASAGLGIFFTTANKDA